MDVIFDMLTNSLNLFNLLTKKSYFLAKAKIIFYIFGCYTGEFSKRVRDMSFQPFVTLYTLPSYPSAKA